MDSTTFYTDQMAALDGHAAEASNQKISEQDTAAETSTPVSAGQVPAAQNATSQVSAAQVSATQVSAAQLLAALYGPIGGALADVEDRIHCELQSQYESLVPLLRHGTQLGGKRLRPAMLLLCAAAVNEINDSHIALGTVIEMVHTATLIHDDVLDEADTRRHVPTISSRWDNHTSILLGDFLFAQSFRLAASVGCTETFQMVGEAARRICEGELRQVLDRNVIDLDEETYIDILRGKTAELCQVACQLGSKHAGGDEAITTAMGQYGDAVGIAFQIADDYLDLWGDDKTVGKTLGTDIEQGKMTLPIIRLLETASADDRHRIVAIITGPPAQRIDQIRDWLEASDARDYTAGVAKRYQQEAIDALRGLEPSQAKDCLLAIASFAVDRTF